MTNGSGDRILIQLKNEAGDKMSGSMDIPLDITPDKLQLICNAIKDAQDDIVPYTFYVDDEELTGSLKKALEVEGKPFDSERTVAITCLPQAIYRVKAVTRCSSSMPGHAEPVVSAQFNYDGRKLASGSGDCTVRFWDIDTETPMHTCAGHRHWVLVIAWSPDGMKVASADKSGQILFWDSKSGAQCGAAIVGHKNYISSMSWEPFHSNPECRHIVSGSKDCTLKVTDCITGKCIFTLSGHTNTVTAVKWGGTGLIYSASQDRTIKVWRASDGVLCRTLEGHAHWVNSLALSTDYALRISFFDPKNPNEDRTQLAQKEKVDRANKRYQDARGDGERLVSGSDDFTLFLWSPETDKKHTSRMTGHMQLVNDVKFSPDARIIASASFDKSIKLWDGKTGKFLSVLRGHVQAVYQISWSSDSRLLVSGSQDSTLKVFDVTKKALLSDLPGHADQVFAVDWSPDGQKVVSGGKDKVLKVWRR